MKASNQPLKGMLDEDPAAYRKVEWITKHIDQVAKQFAYEAYDLPLLEPLSLYSDGSGDDIYHSQAYTFVDKGERELILRPEVTRSLARVVSKHIREVPKPLRWYSVLKCYRYERPQKGRLREFRQLNVDLIGDKSLGGDVEVMMMVVALMDAFGVPKKAYRVCYNSRAFLKQLLMKWAFSPEDMQFFYRLVDAVGHNLLSLNAEVTLDTLEPFLNLNDLKLRPEKLHKIIDYLNASDLTALLNDTWHGEVLPPDVQSLLDFRELLEHLGLGKICQFDVKVVRGLSYYTGMVFEVFDRSDSNERLKRSLFGGGRYDNLIGNFSKNAQESFHKVSGVGFGMGLNIVSLFLESLDMMDEEAPVKEDSFYLAPMEAKHLKDMLSLSHHLRQDGFKVECAYLPLTPSKALKKNADKKHRYVVLIGDDQRTHPTYRVRDILRHDEAHVPMTGFKDFCHRRRTERRKQHLKKHEL